MSLAAIPLVPLPDGVTAEYLHFHRVCPHDVDSDGSLVMFVAPDALLEDALPELSLAFGRPVVTELASWERIVDAIARYRSGDESSDIMVSDDVHADLRDLALQPPVVRFVNTVIRDAVAQGASDVHLEATRDGSSTRFRIDGRLTAATAPPPELRHAVISRIKLLADMDIAERRRPQDGRIRVRLESREIDLRVATVPTLHGESVVLRLLEPEGRPTSLGELGLPQSMHAQFRRLVMRPHGLVLVTGPTGSGKTTTLYSALHCRDLRTEKVLTVEDPVEYQLRDVAQVPVHRSAGVSFAAALRSILRQDPDVLMVGEMRDTETAEVAVQAAMTGHLVLSTVHTVDALSAVPRLFDLGVPTYLVASALSGVLAQRLVRRNCQHCLEEYQPEAEQLDWITADLGALPKLFRGTGCDQCRGVGYRGRLGIFELLSIDEPVRNAIATGHVRGDFQHAARAARPISMRADGHAKISAHLTTVDEVFYALHA